MILNKYFALRNLLEAESYEFVTVDQVIMD